MAPYCATYTQQCDGRGLPCGMNSGRAAFFEEKRRYFASAARTLVAHLLRGKVEIQIHDIQLDIVAERAGAIFISERISNNPDFRRMWAETSCRAMLKRLALKSLER